MHRLASIVLAATFALLGAACERGEAKPASAPRPLASFQDIMVSIVDPAADRLWDSVSVEVTRKGVEEKQPRNDEEWQDLRNQAVALVEAANLLLVEHRPLAAPGKALDNKEGYLDLKEIQASIERTRPAFVAHVHGFQDAATQALAAIDAKNPAGVIDAGARIQQACEQCHLQYWYPNGGAPSLAEFKLRASAPSKAR